MRKASKSKKTKIPKLTEAEYAEYISSLKTSDASTVLQPSEAKPPVGDERNNKDR